MLASKAWKPENTDYLVFITPSMLMRVKITWHSPCFAPIAITAQIESCTKLGVWGVTLLIVEPNSKRAHNNIIRENRIPSPIIHLACSFSSGDRSLELKTWTETSVCMRLPFLVFISFSPLKLSST